MSVITNDGRQIVVSVILNDCKGFVDNFNFVYKPKLETKSTFIGTNGNESTDSDREINKKILKVKLPNLGLNLYQSWVYKTLEFHTHFTFEKNNWQIEWNSELKGFPLIGLPGEWIYLACHPYCLVSLFTIIYNYDLTRSTSPYFLSQGTLKGFDQTINLILDESHERVYSTVTGVEQVVLGLYIIRGDNM